MLPSTEEGRKKIRASAAEHAHLISRLLYKIPHELLLLLKTNDCLRTVDSCLGQVCALLYPLLLSMKGETGLYELFCK